jgi:hypothetical protein
MEIKVYRSKNSSGTLGAIFVDEQYVCLSLELYSPPEGEEHIKGKCCVPLGRYQVIGRTEGSVYQWMKSLVPEITEHGVPWIYNISGEDYPVWINNKGILPEQCVLIHIGNHLDDITGISDTAGCLLVGTTSVSDNVITDSTGAFKKLYSIIKEEMKNENLFITYEEV